MLSPGEDLLYPRVKDAYKDKTIFITGGSGFLGKVIIEKLFRSCSSMNKIYMLLRPKRNKSIQERLDAMLKLELFKEVLEKDPWLAHKIIPVFGDITKPRLGMVQADWDTLAEEVDIVIHSAATVRFDEHIKIALQMNVLATMEVMQLCKAMRHLQLLCHVSTAYSNVDKEGAIQERVYPLDTDPRKVLSLLDWMSDDMLEAIAPSLIKGFPNTYTYTKNLAEYLLNEEKLAFPVVIYRPSIISVTKDSPVEGWIDNFNGPSGIIAAVGKGLLRTIRYNSVTITDIVPVDYVSNGLLVSIWDNLSTKPSEPVVYNCTSGNVNPMEWGLLKDEGMGVLGEVPFEDFFRRPNFDFAPNSFVHYYWIYVSHRIPAFIADALSILVGAKPQVSKMYGKIDKAVESLQFFIENGFEWDGRNFILLQKKLNDEDAKEFSFDMSVIKWDAYIRTVVFGVKKYLMKDDLSDLSKVHRQVKRHRIVRWLSCTLLSILSWRILFTKSVRFRQYWESIASILIRIMQFVQSFVY